MKPRRLSSLLVPPTLVLTVVLALPVSASTGAAAPDAAPLETAPPGKRPLELVDLMKMRQIESPSISRDGRWVAYALEPDRGDGEAVARSTEGAGEVRIERGSVPALSADGRWLGALVQPPLVERLEAEEKKGGGGKKGKKGDDGDGPKTGLAVVPLHEAAGARDAGPGAGARIEADRVEAFGFSGDGRWVAWKHFEEEEPGETDEEADGEEGEKIETPAEQPPGEELAPEEIPEEILGAQIPEEEIRREEIAEAREIGGEPEGGEEGGEDAEEGEKEDERVGTLLVLRRLSDGSAPVELRIPHVESWAFDETGAWLAYSIAAPGGEGNGLFVRDLRDEDGVAEEGGEGGGGAPEIELVTETRGRYTELTWTHEDVAEPVLAFVAAVDDEEGDPGDGALWVWEGPGRAARTVVASADAGEGWFVPSVNTLVFSRDGERLFFGRKPVAEKVDREGEKKDEKSGEGSEEGEASEESGEEPPIDPYDLEALVEKREVTVWHGDDPLIQTNQKERWEEVKDRTYTAVVHLGEPGAGSGGTPGTEGSSDRVVFLADTAVREVRPSDNPRTALGVAEDPWMKHRTWEGFFSDLDLVDLDDGSRRPVARKLSEDPSLSPDGRFVLYYQDAHWHLFDGESGASRNLTAGLPVSFADEDHDYPSSPPGYSVAGWVAEEGSRGTESVRVTAVLVTDKYDLWQLPVDPETEPLRLTAGRGREQEVLFRVVELDPEQRAYTPGERLLLTEYHDRDKSWGFATATVGEEGVATLVHEPRRFRFVGRAEDADVLLYTRESYTEFPDLRVADLDLAATGAAQPLRSGGVRISDANPRVSDFAWGKAELVEWTSVDGEPLQGVLIRPSQVPPGERVPVLVYFYRFFSQRLHQFNEPVVNHRPSFPFYASHGYAVFLPDIRFEVGRPGLSAVKALVPGVQKLVEMGVADPDAVGLHGHSWSGYQTAFVVTQTDLFKAAVAGAPVSNMTSAYSGIRGGSGLARQFQYERSQSRIGGSLWEARHLYIENSPVFYADRIHTPLLIEFGDQDEAVPWTQGIELYLALRRLGKDVVFLQYQGEPHHLQKYPNKVDYTIKMKEFFDHHLKGEPAPEWMTEGVPYRGE